MVLGGRPMRDSIAVFCQVRSPVTADVPLSERGVLGGRPMRDPIVVFRQVRGPAAKESI